MRYRLDPPYPPNNRRQSPNADSTLRASDAERNEVADRLSRHFAEGRLDQAEFKERLDQAMGATTRGDLTGLFDDLPPLASEVPVRPPHPSRRRRLLPLLVIVALVVLATGVSMPFVHVPWLLLVLMGLYLWHRANRRYGHHHHPAEIGN